MIKGFHPYYYHHLKGDKLGFYNTIKRIFKTTDTAMRTHKDNGNLCQLIYQILAGYFNDANELTREPVFTNILDKESLASQLTLSQFFNRMDTDTLGQFNEILKKLIQATCLQGQEA